MLFSNSVGSHFEVIKEESQLLDSQNHVIVQSSGVPSLPILLPGGGVYPASSGGGLGNHSLAHLQFFQLPEAYLGNTTSNNAINNTNSKNVTNHSNGAASEPSLSNALPKSNHPQTLERSVFQEFWENLKSQQDGQQSGLPTPTNVHNQPPPIARVGAPRGDMDEDEGEMRSPHRKERYASD